MIMMMMMMIVIMISTIIIIIIKIIIEKLTRVHNICDNIGKQYHQQPKISYKHQSKYTQKYKYLPKNTFKTII